MTREAEEYAQEDAQFRENLEAKNKLENFIYQNKSMIEDEKMKDKISEEDKNKITEHLDKTLQWLESNRGAMKEEYEEKMKELEEVCKPIMMGLYGGGMPGGMPDGMPGGMPASSEEVTNNGPGIEEID